MIPVHLKWIVLSFPLSLTWNIHSEHMTKDKGVRKKQNENLSVDRSDKNCRRIAFFFFAPLHVAEEPTATQLSTLGNFVHIE